MKNLAPPVGVLGRVARGAALVLAVSWLCGCVTYTAPVKPPLGFVYCDIKAPLTANYNGNPTGTGLTKVSQTQTQYFMEPLLTHFSFGFDDVAIAKIARQGGIKEVSYADYEFFNVLGVYARFKVNVYGN